MVSCSCCLLATAEKPKEHAMDAQLFELLTEAGLEASKKLDLGVSVSARHVRTCHA